MQKKLKSFLIIFLCMQCLTAPISAYYNQYHPVPIVPHRTTNPEVEIGAGGILIGGIGLCVSLYVVISEWLNTKAEKKSLRLYNEMFKNLGYNDVQADAYAKIAVINSGGFKAVVDFIEWEKKCGNSKSQTSNLPSFIPKHEKTVCILPKKCFT